MNRTHAKLTRKPHQPDFVAACTRGDHATAHRLLRPEDTRGHHLTAPPPATASASTLRHPHTRSA